MGKVHAHFLELEKGNCLYVMQLLDFLELRWKLVRSPRSSEDQQAMRGLAYLVVAVKLYNGPNTLISNPLRGGLRGPAEKLDMHVRRFQKSPFILNSSNLSHMSCTLMPGA